MGRIKLVFKQIILLGVNGIGVVALCLIVYGYVTLFTGDSWKTLDSIANWLSVSITLFGLLFVALSVYMPVHARGPDSHSKWFTAPLMLIIVCLAVIVSVVTNTFPPPIAVNGFAILAITGSVFRALPFSEWERHR